MRVSPTSTISQSVAVSGFNYRNLAANPIHWISFGFGLGLMPKAPGTFGTLLGIAIVYFTAPIGSIEFAMITAVLFCVGIGACQVTAGALERRDPEAIVWDEAVGYCVAMLFVPISAVTLALGFVLFRFFDIWKPWPISAVDRQVHGGFGIMLDDLIAGAFTCALLQLVVFLWLA